MKKRELIKHYRVFKTCGISQQICRVPERREKRQRKRGRINLSGDRLINI